MPDDQRRKLCSYVLMAHKYGKKVRLWASPENDRVWAELLKCGVDLINTDKLSQLKTFLLTHSNSINTNKIITNFTNKDELSLITL